MEDGICCIPFVLPAVFLVGGASFSGKTQLIKRLLCYRKGAFEQEIARVIFCYSMWQDIYEDLEIELGDDIEFRTDIPKKEELNEIAKGGGHTLLIIDDKMNEISDSNRNIIDIVCVLCHHLKVSCMVTVQNIFFNAKWLRMLSSNAQYFILFRNNRSVQQIRILASQIMPGKLQYFMDAYEKATADAYGYLVVDLRPKDDIYKLRSKILGDGDPVVYVAK